jgi:NAD(P)-dependent dehydrogenase (short-subunit alcohol dehydrogenase family)
MPEQAPPGQGSAALVIGASSRIARELIRQLAADADLSRVIAVSRSNSETLAAELGGRLQWLQSDYSESSIEQLVGQLMAVPVQINRVFLCNGVLHDDSVFPEKRLEDFTTSAFHRVMQINALLPALWLKHLKPLLRGGPDCVVTAFSARVGSIEDNQRGGWYSYRASKAALNMLLKSAAIEYRRSCPGVRFLAFHPGTTDTPLSAPFQQSVPSGKLFSADFVAGRLLTVIAGLKAEPAIQYLDWEGKAIAW